MRRKPLILLLIAVLCIGQAVLAYSADELFDTKAAALHTEKGVELLKAKKYDAAIREFEESVTIAPDAEAYYLLGYAYYIKGKTEDGESRKKSKESFDKAYELNPNFSPSRLKLTEPAKAEPAQPAPAAPQPKPGAEEQASKVFQGTAQPGQETPPPPEPQPQEPPKEQQPPQQQEQPKQ